MTTLTELGEMLIAVERDGRKLQIRTKDADQMSWRQRNLIIQTFDLDEYEYRLTPIPETLTLYEYVPEDCPGSIWVRNFIQTIFVNGIHHQKTGRVIRDGVISDAE